MTSTTQHASAQYTKKAIPMWMVRRLLEQPRQRLWEAFERHFPPTPVQRVLNLGCNASSDDPSRYFFEPRYPHHARTVAAGLEPGDQIAKAYPDIEYRQLSRGQARLPFDDDAFDLVFCNAVIEHVGTRAQQREFLGEILRVGRAAYVTTPNRWYPVETHTVLPLLHYLPPSVYRPAYAKLGFDFFAAEENLNLLDEKELLDLVSAADRPRCQLDHVRFLGLKSNLLLVVKPLSAK